jgi:hypothetical protein
MTTNKLSLTFLITLLVLTSCGGGQNNHKTPEQLKLELKQREVLNPVKYLSEKNVSLELQQKKVKSGGLFRDAEYVDDGALIEGVIVNRATLAKFKDIVVRVSYYSKTKTLLEEKSYRIYEFFEPNSSKHFSLKVNPPKAFASFDLQVVDAEGVR